MAYRKTSGAPGSTRMAMSSLMEENPRDHREVGEEMLSNIGRQVLELLRAGGNKFLDFDEKYANAVQRTVFPEKLQGTNSPMNAVRGAAYIGAGMPIRDSIDLRATVLKEMQGKERIAAEALQVGIPVANVAARYGLPAAGAVGLAELTSNLYDYASEQPLL